MTKKFAGANFFVIPWVEIYAKRPFFLHTPFFPPKGRARAATAWSCAIFFFFSHPIWAVFQWFFRGRLLCPALPCLSLFRTVFNCFTILLHVCAKALNKVCAETVFPSAAHACTNFATSLQASATQKFSNWALRFPFGCISFCQCLCFAAYEKVLSSVCAQTVFPSAAGACTSFATTLQACATQYIMPPSLNSIASRTFFPALSLVCVCFPPR